MKKPNSIVVFGGFLIAVLILINFSVVFGVVTFVLSIWVLSELEIDKNAHELSFYVKGKPIESIKEWLKRYAVAEVLVRSFIFGVLTIFLFSGTDGTRLFWISIAFYCCILLGYFGLRYAQRRTEIDVTRWGYIRMSVVLGAVFSMLSSLAPSPNAAQVSVGIARHKLGLHQDIHESAELLYGLNRQFNDFVSSLLSTIFGEFLGGILSLIFSTNVMYGFVVFIYTILLLKFLSIDRVINQRGTE